MSPVEVLILAVAVVNVWTFLAFGVDKWRAKRGRRRIPEARLLLLMWLTGFVGGWLGSHLFRHKTVKRSFRLKMVFVTGLNPVWPLLYLWWAQAVQR